MGADVKGASEKSSTKLIIANEGEEYEVSLSGESKSVKSKFTYKLELSSEAKAMVDECAESIGCSFEDFVLAALQMGVSTCYDKKRREAEAVEAEERHKAFREAQKAKRKAEREEARRKYLGIS